MAVEIDPEGDTLLRLKNPVTELADWIEEPEARAWKILYNAPDDYPTVEAESSGATQESINEQHTAHDSPPTINNADTEPPPPPELNEEEAEPPIDEVEPEIHYRVSSGQLKNTSEYFRRMFKGGYRETSPDAADGLRHIEAFYWDPEALLILLNIIHARNKLVPQVVTLEMLAKLAQIVDYYKLTDVVSIWSEMWIGELKKRTMPTDYCWSSVLWTFISWVFGDSDVFEKMTAVALKQSRGKIQTFDLPIPQFIIDSIDERRQDVIKAIIIGLHSLLAELRDGKKGCSFTCGSMLLGSLMRYMHSNNLLSDLSSRPQSPFLGLSFEDTANGIRSMVSPLWTDQLSYYGYDNTWHACKLEDMVQPIVAGMDQSMKGLRLEEFGVSGRFTYVRPYFVEA
ncbi:hypothetical protein K469DRAFT_635224 [Zopfia rhizophila CBS 207.26]|uniref:Uncharacterized protein n=1 Tax=Zopfia rhizophila CBS 207.26 TaxID=1314779 RepID=A0A6A6DUN0_9PEZI|nr:hypothetical protein K469DRAFT_635224 [Zopfia rhizophila CBS 207.26]